MQDQAPSTVNKQATASTVGSNLAQAVRETFLERIVAAAIRYRRVDYSVPAPGRHHDVIRVMSERGLGPGAMHNQGFVTSTGRFVNRCEAFKIASEARQIIKKTGNANSQDLYSEDVW